jgi:trimeric autotransporter adhesin
VIQLARSLTIGSLFLGLQILGLGQSVTLSVGSGSATAGTTVSLPINLSSSGGAQTAGLQWSFIYSSDITSVTVAAGPSATNAGKSVTCSGSTCLILGFNNTAMADGTVATATFQIASSPSTTSIPIQITGVVASTATGSSILASGGTGTISLPVPPPSVSVSVSPLSATLTASQSKLFTAAVTGNANTGVAWSMTPAIGSLSNGLYTAPTVINSAQSVTITATSVVDTSKSASATVQLVPPGSVIVSVNPPSATLAASQTSQFSATVTGNANTAVTWSMTPSIGSLVNGLYTAPAVINSSLLITITATSVADASKSASAAVTLVPPAGGGVSVGVSPPSAALSALKTAQFTALVTGSANTSVTWSMTPSVGTLSNGLYTAPPVVNATQSVTITAKSVADPSKTATAIVQLMPTAPPAAGAVIITEPTTQPTFVSSKNVLSLAGTASSTTTQVVWATDQGLQGLAQGTTNWTASGITLRNGSNQITVAARDTAGNETSTQITVIFSSPVIVTTALPDAQIGKIYSSKLAAAGGTLPYTWTASSVPNGLTLSKDGMLTGTPGAAGTFTLNITLQDSLQIVSSAAVKVRVDSGLVLVSAASQKPGPVAPGSMVTVFGAQLAGGAQSASVRPLPTTLEDCTVTVKDANGVERPAGLYFVSPNQINFQIPPDTAVGSATVTVVGGDQTQTLASVSVSTIAPGLFSLNPDGLAAADVTRINGSNTSYEPVAQLDNATGLFVAVPIDLGSDTDKVYLTLYGTGVRNRTSLDAVQVLVANVLVPVDFAGPSTASEGLDLIHVLLPGGLRGTGTATVLVTVNGVSSNGVRIAIK